MCRDEMQSDKYRKKTMDRTTNGYMPSKWLFSFIFLSFRSWTTAVEIGREKERKEKRRATKRRLFRRCFYRSMTNHENLCFKTQYLGDKIDYDR